MNGLISVAWMWIQKISKLGQTALYFAAHNGHVDVVRELLRHEDIIVDSGDEGCLTALHGAGARGHIDVVRELLAHNNTIVNSWYNCGLTPLEAI